MKVYNLHEITDSKVQYDKKPPAFMYYVVLIVLSIVIIGLVWANNSVKTYIVKGQGLVATENKSHIMAKGSGEVTEVFVKEGAVVKAGDILFTTNELEADLQLEQIEAKIKTYNDRIELLKKAEENATNGTNSFDKNNVVESEFYNKLQAAYSARKEFYVDIEALKEDAIKQVDEEMAAKEEEIDPEVEPDIKPEVDVKPEPEIEAQPDVETENKPEVENETENSTPTELGLAINNTNPININKEEELKKERAELLQEKMDQIDEYVISQGNKENEHYFKTISEFTNERKQYEMEVSSLIAQKDAYGKSKEQYVVTAQVDGIVHLNTPLTVGMVVQGGNLVGTISENLNL